MEAVFLKIVNMSITAGWLILAVTAVRLLFRRMPKWVLCLLWGMVAFRLLCPVALEWEHSFLPSAEPLPKDIIYTAQPQLQSGIIIVDNTVNPMLASSMIPVEPASANPTQIWSFILSQIWILGMAVMLVYALVSYLLLKHRVRTSIPVRENIRRCEWISDPFVLGILEPKIYLPASLEKSRWEWVLKHEESHIERNDHRWKLLGFLILTVHWFNPMVWLAYCLFCRDMEGACDERVIQNLEDADRRAYAAAILDSSIPKHRKNICPLAFGEVGVKARVKSVVKYKKPGFIIGIVSVLLCGLLAVGFLTDPVKVYEYGKVYSQAELRAPDKIEILTTNNTIVYEKDTEKYHRVLDALRKNWWKYTQDDLETASDELLIAPPAPETLRTSANRTTMELSDTLIRLFYTSDPIRWENYEGETIPIEIITFVLTGKSDSPENTRGYFTITREENIGYNEGLYTYYYPPEIAQDFWEFLTEKPQDDITEVLGNTLSINDVIILSKKGEELTASDFHGYAYLERGGPLLYNREYPINAEYALWLSHGGGIEEPIYLWLVHLPSGDNFDITQGNADNQITDFVFSHSNQ